MLKNNFAYSLMMLGWVNNTQASQQLQQILQPPQSLPQVGQPKPTGLTSIPQKPALVTHKLEAEVKTSQQKHNIQFTFPREGLSALTFNLVDAAKLDNNDLLFSIIRNKETLAKIMGRTVVNAELNSLTNARQKIFADIIANLNTQYDTYVGKPETIRKTKLRDSFKKVVANTNTIYQDLIQKKRAGAPLNTVEETLQFILDHNLPLDSFFAEVISVLYGLNVQVLTPLSGNPSKLKDVLVNPVFVKATVDPLFVLHSGSGSAAHFDKLYPGRASSQARPKVSPSQSNLATQKTEIEKKTLSQNQVEIKKVTEENKASVTGTNAPLTLPREGLSALTFNLVDAVRLDNNDLLFSIIRNKETLAKIMGRTVLQAELNSLTNVRQKLFADILANLETQYDSYVGKTGTTKKTKLRDHFGNIISRTNTNYQSLIAKQRAGKPLKTVEETLQFILDNRLPLDSFFAEVISVLYGLNVQVLTPLSGNPRKLKDVLGAPVFVKATVDPLFVLHSGSGSAAHFDKLYPGKTSGQTPPTTTTLGAGSKPSTSITQITPVKPPATQLVQTPKSTTVPHQRQSFTQAAQLLKQTLTVDQMRVSAEVTLATNLDDMIANRESAYRDVITVYAPVAKVSNPQLHASFERNKAELITKIVNLEKNLLAFHKIMLKDKVANLLRSIGYEKERNIQEIKEFEEAINKGEVPSEELPEVKQYIKELHAEIDAIPARMSAVQAQERVNEAFLAKFLNEIEKENKDAFQRLYNEIIK